MDFKTILTEQAPAPIGPYSQATQLGNLLFVSGQIPLNPATNEMEQSNIIIEAYQVMKNLEAVLTAAGSGFDKVVKTTIFLTDMKDFAQVNDVYASHFKSNFPARETVQVSALPKGANVEISVIAYV